MKKIRILTITGAVFTLIAGTLMHFIYEWVGGAAAIVGAVNESTWEHLKLVFWPMLLFTIFEYFVYGKKAKGFLPIKTVSILVGMALIIVLFYTYSGIVGKNLLPADISVFVIAVLTAYLLSYRLLTTPKPWSQSRWAVVVSLMILVLLITCFVVFTYYPPSIGLFLDPVTGTYGINY